MVTWYDDKNIKILNKIEKETHQKTFFIAIIGEMIVIGLMLFSLVGIDLTWVMILIEIFLCTIIGFMFGFLCAAKRFVPRLDLDDD